MRVASEHASLAQAIKRRVALEGELTLSAGTIAPAGFIFSPAFYTPGFDHFAGQLDAQAAAATAIDIRIQPTIINNALFVNNEFTITTLALFVGPVNRYAFYWGLARGVVLDAFGSGASYVMNEAWRFIIRNTGANPVDSISLTVVECW